MMSLLATTVTNIGADEYDFGPDPTEEELELLDKLYSDAATNSPFPPLNLCDLPDDIMFLIMSFCDVLTLLKISSVCKKLHDISNEDSLWKRFFERDYPGTRVPHATLKQLQDIVATRLHYDRIGKMIDSRLDIKGCPWKEIYFQYGGTGHLLSREQQTALDAVKNGKNVMITGCAGTGKSYLLGVIRSELRRLKKEVAVCASTGLAAFNIDGQTIHSWAGIGRAEQDYEWRKAWGRKEQWREVEVLILDEISMLSDVFISKLDDLAREIRGNHIEPFGGIQVILSGDFCQLPPVRDKTFPNKSSSQQQTQLPLSQGTSSQPSPQKSSQHSQSQPQQRPGYCFESATFQQAFENPLFGCIVNLTRVFRQEETAWINALAELRVGRVSQRTMQLLRARDCPVDMSDGIEPTRIYPTNSEVDKVNAERLKELTGESVQYKAGDSLAINYDKCQTPKAQADAQETLQENVRVLTSRVHSSFELKIGAQVILIRNTSRRLVNGSRGVVVGFQAIENVVQDQNWWTDFGLELYHPPLIQSFFVDQPLIPLVRFTTEERLIPPVPFTMKRAIGEAVRIQLPLKLGWACTVHGAQGMTLDKAQISVGRCFEFGQIYSALSRVRTLKGLYLKDFPPQLGKLADPRVLEWYARFQTPPPPPQITLASPAATLHNDALIAQRAREEATRRGLRDIGPPPKRTKPSSE